MGCFACLTLGLLDFGTLGLWDTWTSCLLDLAFVAGLWDFGTWDFSIFGLLHFWTLGFSDFLTLELSDF